MLEPWLFLACLTALAWGLDPVLVKFAYRSGIEPMPALFVRLTGALIGISLFMAAQPGLAARAAAAPAGAIAALMASGVLGAIIGHLSNFAALRAGDAARVMPVQLALAPAVTFALALLLLGERVTLRHVAGLALVAAGVALLAWRGGR
jgi:uncharacterized membrane protein